MKTLMLGCIVLLSTFLAKAGADKSDLDERIHELTAKFEAMQWQAGKRVPPEMLQKAKGIILLDRTKAGFVFAYQGGNGVALAKDEKTGKWSPAAFLSANEASIGFQVGGEQNFFVILLMNTNANALLTDPSFQVGSEARGTAGDASANVERNISSTERPVLVYDDRKGLYAGADVKAGAIRPDEDANRVYYGRFVTMNDILFGKKISPTPPATDLASRISEFSKVP
jgi:SH3 domain-containing YSC84-like protein 1